MACHGYATWFPRVLELAVAARQLDQTPPVLLNELDEVANLHFDITASPLDQH
jgi:hypothetical protein